MGGDRYCGEYGGRSLLWRVWGAIAIVESMGGDRLTLTEYFKWVNSVGFSPDGQTLPSGSNDETIKLWRLR